MNTPPNSVDFSAAQLEIPFAQPESPSIQSETQSTLLAPSPSLESADSALADPAIVEKVKLHAEELNRQKVQKNKKERVKAAFNLMDYIVKYYNTGETYVSRAFTLVGMVSLMMLGANRLTTLEGGLANFAPPSDIFPTLLTNIQSAIPTNSSEEPRNTKAIPMESSFEQVTRLQPALVSPTFAPANPTSSESAPAPESVPAPVIEPAAPSAPPTVKSAPWVSPAPEIPPVSLPLPEVNAPLPTTVQETITEVQQGIQQAAEQLNQATPLPEIVSPQPANSGAKITEVQQGVQQAAGQLATEQFGQIASPSIPGVGSIPAVPNVPAIPNVPAVPNVPAGIPGIFGGGDD